MSYAEITEVATLCALAMPLAVLAILAGAGFFRQPLPERIVGNLSTGAMTGACLALVLALAAFLGSGRNAAHVSVLPPGQGQSFTIELFIDTHGLVFSVMAAFVCAIVAAFGHRYMHREPGYYRYFVQFNLFCLGILLIGLAGSTTLLFAGWEFLGLSSALLVAFFHDRPAPVANALRVFVVYRLGDAALLTAAILAQHEFGGVQLDNLFVGQQAVNIGAGPATAIAFLLVVAAAAKCAQLPFSGWIPRAMEGPTPSSAVFYGALSIHAGAFVLLRAAPILEAAPSARIALGAMGLSTALFAMTVGRVQTDVKSMLAFASLTQVSIILVEIALGWYDIALVHMVGHALFRLQQFLRSPSVLHDFHEATHALGGHRKRDGGLIVHVLPVRWRSPAYRFALERGSLDSALDRFVVGPFVGLSGWFDRLERTWCALCAGRIGGPTRRRDAGRVSRD